MLFDVKYIPISSLPDGSQWTSYRTITYIFIHTFHFEQSPRALIMVIFTISLEAAGP